VEYISAEAEIKSFIGFAFEEDAICEFSVLGVAIVDGGGRGLLPARFGLSLLPADGGGEAASGRR
jgi:hypothetical protein